MCGPTGPRFGLEFCKTSSFSAGGQGSGGRIATMIKIEIPEDDLSGVDAKQRTTSPMADDLASPCNFNVHSVKATLHGDYRTGKIKSDQAVEKRPIMRAVARGQLGAEVPTRPIK